MKKRGQQGRILYSAICKQWTETPYLKPFNWEELDEMLRSYLRECKKSRSITRRKSLFESTVSLMIEYAGPEIQKRVESLPKNPNDAILIIESWLSELKSIREKGGYI